VLEQQRPNLQVLFMRVPECIPTHERKNSPNKVWDTKSTEILASRPAAVDDRDEEITHKCYL
jgi:hypothetical protein